MNIDESEALERYASVLRCSRKISGISQAEMADCLKISQSKMSKLESGKLMPSAVEIFQFSEETGISIYSFQLGYIEKPKVVEVNSSLKENGFSIPVQYRKLRNVGVRYLWPLINLVKKQIKNGDKLFEKFCKKNKIDPDFFIYWENTLNFQFVMDFLIEVINKIGVEEFNKKLSLVLLEKENQGEVLKPYYDKVENNRSIKRLTDCYNDYYNCLDYSFLGRDEESLSFNVSMKEDIRKVINSSDGADFAELYFKLKFEKLFSLAMNNSLKSEWSFRNLLENGDTEARLL